MFLGEIGMTHNTGFDEEGREVRAAQVVESEEFASSNPRSPSPIPSWLNGWKGLLIGLGTGVAIATLLPRLMPSPPPSATPAAEAQTKVAPGQSVSVETAKLGLIANQMNATGTVDARDWVMVKAQASGLQIQQILVAEGQTVQAGQNIALLDNSVLQSQLNQARAQLSSSQAQLSSTRAQLASLQAAVVQKRALLKQQQATLAEAESNLRRYQELAQQGAETRQNLESRTTTVATARESVNVAQANIASAQADVSRARAEVSRAAADVQNNQAQVQKLETQLGQAIVKAPVSGVLAKPGKDSNGKPLKDVRVGDITGADPLFYIITDGGLELRLQVPESNLSQIQVGSAVQISSDADKRIKGQGGVREVDPVVNEQTRQAIVKVDLPTSPYLKPGMFLKAAVVTQTNQALMVPSQSVLPQTDGRSIVYVLEGKDTVRQRPVTVGMRQNTADPAQARTEIKAGLKPGDRVVVAGAGFLKDGDHVTVAKQF